MTVPAQRSRRWADTVGLVTVGVVIGLAFGFGDHLRRKGPTASTVPMTGIPREAADRPTEISARGWRRVLARTWSEFNDDRIPAVAAGATFFTLLALFPAMGVFVSLYGLFAEVDGARRQIVALQGILPEGAVSVMGEALVRLAALPHASLSTTFAVSFLISVWSANAGVKALIGGLNVAYEEREHRNFVRLNLVSLAFTLGAITFSLVATGGSILAPKALARLGLSLPPGTDLLRWPLLVTVMVGALSLLYRYGPDRAHARWRWITPGGVLAAVGWMAMSLGFSVYVGHFGSYDRTYGSLGAIVGFMTWIWLSLIVVLLGAELNSEMEQQTSFDTTTGAPRPPGARGAAVSDRVRRRAHG